MFCTWHCLLEMEWAWWKKKRESSSRRPSRELSRRLLSWATNPLLVFHSSFFSFHNFARYEEILIVVHTIPSNWEDERVREEVHAEHASLHSSQAYQRSTLWTGSPFYESSLNRFSFRIFQMVLIHIVHPQPELINEFTRIFGSTQISARKSDVGLLLSKLKEGEQPLNRSAFSKFRASIRYHIHLSRISHNILSEKFLVSRSRKPALLPQRRISAPSVRSHSALWKTWTSIWEISTMIARHKCPEVFLRFSYLNMKNRNLRKFSSQMMWYSRVPLRVALPEVRRLRTSVVISRTLTDTHTVAQNATTSSRLLENWKTTLFWATRRWDPPSRMDDTVWSVPDPDALSRSRIVRN